MKKKKPASKLQRDKKNPSSKYWRNKADPVWSELIRGAKKCARCGRTGVEFDAHHLVHRGVATLRHKLENGMCLCRGCHRFNRGSAHGNDAWLFAKWLEDDCPVLWVWMNEHRWQTGKPDYRGAFEKLTAIQEATK